jgi:Predicted Zn-dependent hydrolases of the beta-lactamase fold
MPSVSADVITISHEHNDHNNVSAVSGEPILLNTQGFFEVKGVHVRSLETSHDDADGAKRGKNLVFQFRMDGVEVCHMGDIGEECNASVAEALVPVNVLLIPIGGTFTIDAEQAKEYVNKLMPDVVIPMHFKTKDCKFDIAELDDFLDLFDRDEIEYLDVNTVEFDRYDFDGESTRVLVFSDMQ